MSYSFYTYAKKFGMKRIFFIPFTLLCICLIFSSQQEAAGTISNVNGFAHSNIKIVIHESDKGTFTALQGAFAVQAIPGQVFLISCIRYGLQQTAIGNNISLKLCSDPVKTFAFQISLLFWNEWWFRIIAIICIFGIFYGITRWRLQKRFSLKLEHSEKQMELADMRQKMAELKQQATELEIQALRSQMNPHFIFNALSCINRFILQNNKAQASEYLTKFSKLVRLILQNSQASLVTLESELESLGLYLEMEALRFNYHFAYKISVQENPEIEGLKVPPFIIQPYVENAIWHGLMHKEDKGHLDIEVSQENEWLYFKVTDNGIGRKKASELASKSATKHKLMGLRITANRIAMMQGTNGNRSSVLINDLENPDRTAAGTEVIIKIPVNY